LQITLSATPKLTAPTDNLTAPMPYSSHPRRCVAHETNTTDTEAGERRETPSSRQIVCKMSEAISGPDLIQRLMPDQLVRIEIHDKIGALKMLGTALGMFQDTTAPG
jgi:hypothetical protein